MSFVDLRSFIQHLEDHKDLIRVTEEVDPDQDVNIIQHRVLNAGGPALLYENVKGSPYRMITNLFGTRQRVTAAFGRPPAEIGHQIASLADRLMPPTCGSFWREKKTIWNLISARMKKVRRGPVLEEEFCPPQLERLPCLKCWPLDGGRFFTLPLVHTVDPLTGKGNLGIYRMQLYDQASTGMHWQIEKGGGFHFSNALQQGQPMPVSVFLGGPPALTLAAIAPLPEGMDERLLAALMMGRPLEVISRSGSGHRIPARAEFVLEGSVRPNDLHKEGPFGDHLGHYSHSADFPVFRVERLLARKDAIYPATVVGKPPQEDYFIGEALQELTIPLLKMIKPGICDLWAYPETGFHPLATMSVSERYGGEALKQALSVLGEGQLSLTKVLVTVDSDVDVRDFRQISKAIWQNLDTANGLHILSPTAQDTLDFTGPAMNTGSRFIILANQNETQPRRTKPPELPDGLNEIHPDINEMTTIGEAFLMVQVTATCDTAEVRDLLASHPVTREYLFHVMVSPDVPMDDERLMLWGWFTRFDPFADIHPASREQSGNRLILHTPIAIDATWKEGYRQPVEFDPVHVEHVDKNWSRYGIDLG